MEISWLNCLFIVSWSFSSFLNASDWTWDNLAPVFSCSLSVWTSKKIVHPLPKYLSSFSPIFTSVKVTNQFIEKKSYGLYGRQQFRFKILPFSALVALLVSLDISWVRESTSWDKIDFEEVERLLFTFWNKTTLNQLSYQFIFSTEEQKFCRQINIWFVF